MTHKEHIKFVKKELLGLRGDARQRRLEDLATKFQRSVKTINRWENEGGVRWRKERSNKGASKADDTVLDQMGTLLLASRRLSNRTTLPACDAKEILEDSGLLTETISTSLIRSKLRERKMSAKHLCAPSPHVNLLSDHPNHLWEFDVTNCLQYFLDKKGLGERDVEMTLYKNKLVNTVKKIKKELLRYVVIDHCTGAFYVRYFYASGEKASDGERFFLEAMRPKDERIVSVFNGTSGSKIGKYRFHGVPLIVYADKGSIARAKEFQNLFEALNIELVLHMAGNPRAKGMVEGMMNYINRFEARLVLQRPADLDELNRWALDWCIKVNAKDIFRYVGTRSGFWSRITDDQLRLCPEEEIFWRLVSTDPIRKRVSGALLIRHNGLFYRVDDPELANQYVYIRENAYESPAIDVHGNGHVWLVHPLNLDEYGRLPDGVRFGEFRAIKHTETQKAKAGFEKIAAGWGLTWKGSGDKRRAVAPPVGFESPLQVFGHQADKVGVVAFIDKKGTGLEVKDPHTSHVSNMPENKRMTIDAATVSRSIGSRRIPITEFLKRLRDRIGPISPELNQQLKGKHGKSIEIKEAEEEIERLEGTAPVYGRSKAES